MASRFKDKLGLPALHTRAGNWLTTLSVNFIGTSRHGLDIYSAKK